MAKPWYYQMMGAEIGPLTPAELKEKVQIGQIQPDTLVRSGSDGKWIPADRWKGLLPSKEDTQPPPSTSTTKSPEATSTKSDSSSVADTAATIPIDDEDDPLYHMKGEAAGGPIPFSHPDEYDFFQFVGFRHAISHPLYDALVIYSHQHQLTVTQITRLSIAKFIGKPELGKDKPPAPAETENADAEENSEPAEAAAEK